jgi:hypothetical protein
MSASYIGGINRIRSMLRTLIKKRLSISAEPFTGFSNSPLPFYVSLHEETVILRIDFAHISVSYRQLDATKDHFIRGILQLSQQRFEEGTHHSVKSLCRRRHYVHLYETPG